MERDFSRKRLEFIPILVFLNEALNFLSPTQIFYAYSYGKMVLIKIFTFTLVTPSMLLYASSDFASGWEKTFNNCDFQTFSSKSIFHWNFLEKRVEEF